MEFFYRAVMENLKDDRRFWRLKRMHCYGQCASVMASWALGYRNLIFEGDNALALLTSIIDKEGRKPETFYAANNYYGMGEAFRED